MKKLLLLSCIILCAIRGYGQIMFTDDHSHRRVVTRHFIYEDDTATEPDIIYEHIDIPPDKIVRVEPDPVDVSPLHEDTGKKYYFFGVEDTGYSPLLISNDTDYIQDTILKPNNIVGIYGDGSLHIFTAKMLIHRYYQIRYTMSFVTENYHNTWGHQWEIVGGLKSVLDNVVGIYSYEITPGIFRTVSYSYDYRYFKQDKLRNLKIGPHRIPKRTRVRRNGR